MCIRIVWEVGRLREYCVGVCEGTRGTHCVSGVRECCKRMLGMILGRIVGDLVVFVFCKNEIKRRLRNNLIVIKKRKFRQLRL